MMCHLKRLARVFGSLSEVARILEIDKSNISKWRKKVPEKHIDKLIEEAEKLGYILTRKQLRGHR